MSLSFGDPPIGNLARHDGINPAGFPANLEARNP